MGKRCRRGFILADLLLSLSVLMILLPITLLAVRTVSASLSFDEEVQDEIALAQMRRIILLSYDAETSGGDLRITYQGDEMRFTFLHERVILQPGTQIFISQIDSASFHNEGGILYLRYERKGKTYDKAVGRQ